MNKKILLLPLLAALSLVLVACSSTTGSDLSLKSVSDSGRIAPMGDLFYDWKEINIEGGTVNKKFSFKNDADKDLILKGAETTCMCTTATIELPNGEMSPSFGMGGMGAMPQFAYAIKPGEEFKVNVVFDPMAHGPEAVGPIGRSVFLITSSVANGEYAEFDQRSGEVVTEMKLQGDVLKSAAYKELKLESMETGFRPISPEELQQDLAQKDFFLVDVHIPEQEHIEKTDAVIAYNEIGDNLSQLPKDKNTKIVVYCRSGSMSSEASQKLIDLGYKNVYNLEGGRDAYIDSLK